MYIILFNRNPRMDCEFVAVKAENVRMIGGFAIIDATFSVEQTDIARISASNDLYDEVELWQIPLYLPSNNLYV